jgi:hypothetical protein
MPLALKGRVALASSLALSLSTELLINETYCKDLKEFEFTMKTGAA